MNTKTPATSLGDSTGEAVAQNQRSDLVDALARLVVKQHRQQLTVPIGDESTASNADTAKSKPKTRHM